MNKFDWKINKNNFCLLSEALITHPSGGGFWQFCHLRDADESHAGMTNSITILVFSGIDFKIRTIELDGKKIKLQIW